MSFSITSLPSDIAVLLAFAITLQTTLQTRNAELYAKTLHIEKLKMQLAVLRRDRFGCSSEKLDYKIEQLELLIGDLEEGQAKSDERTEAANPGATPMKEKLQPVRMPLPNHLLRERVEHETVCVCPACGSARLTRIGTDEREYVRSSDEEALTTNLRRRWR